MKSKYKKILLAVMLLFVVFGITGCSSNDDYYGSSQNVRDCYEAGYCKSVWK